MNSGGEISARKREQNLPKNKEDEQMNEIIKPREKGPHVVVNGDASFYIVCFHVQERVCQVTSPSRRWGRGEGVR